MSQQRELRGTETAGNGFQTGRYEMPPVCLQAEPSKVHNHTPATEPKPSYTASTTTTVLMLQLQLVTVNLEFMVDAAYDDDDERTGMKPLRPPRRCPLGSPWAHRAPRGTLRPPCIRDGDEAGSRIELEGSKSPRQGEMLTWWRGTRNCLRVETSVPYTAASISRNPMPKHMPA